MLLSLVGEPVRVTRLKRFFVVKVPAESDPIPKQEASGLLSCGETNARGMQRFLEICSFKSSAVQ